MRSRSCDGAEVHSFLAFLSSADLGVVPGADQREAVARLKLSTGSDGFRHPPRWGASGAFGPDMIQLIRHFTSNSNLAFCMRRAASVSLRWLACRSNSSAVMPGFRYCCQSSNVSNFS